MENLFPTKILEAIIEMEKIIEIGKEKVSSKKEDDFDRIVQEVTVQTEELVKTSTKMVKISGELKRIVFGNLFNSFFTYNPGKDIYTIREYDMNKLMKSKERGAAV